MCIRDRVYPPGFAKAFRVPVIGVVTRLSLIHISTTIVVGSVVIIFGAILVTMNPLDFFKKGEV